MSLWPGDSSKTFQTDLNILDKFYHEAPPCALNTLPRLCRQQLPMFTNSGYLYSSWLLWRNLRSFQFILNQSMEWWAILDTFNCFMPSSNESHKFFAFDHFRNYNCSTQNTLWISNTLLTYYAFKKTTGPLCYYMC